jgi:ATP-binding cassette subfamily B protein
MWILLMVIPAVLGILAVFLFKISPLFEVQQRQLDDLNQVLQESLAGVRVVKAFVQGEYENRRYDRTNQAFWQASLHPMRYVAALQPSFFLIVNLATALVLWFGGRAVSQGDSTVGELMAFTQYLVTILVPLVVLATITPQVTAAEASAERMFEVMDTLPNLAQPSQPVLPSATAATQGQIVFENVSFGYPAPAGETLTPVLRNINLTIEPGQTVAFLGATGSGKSTLVNLIPRFYDVTEGRILIDGIDVRDLAPEILHQWVGIALQEAVLFSGTVRENVGYGRPEAEQEDLVAAAAAADAHGFISAMPEGYDAPVARRGSNFSGGQRQRISIARALAVQPRILILDDSTSALDMATEARVQEAVQDLMAATTKLYVAQRISTVLTADRIFLLEAGELVAQGTHETLLATSPLYQDIYQSQLGGAPL